MNAHPLLRQLLIITFISGAVLLSFKYVLPLIFPFLFAYTLMRSLMPIVLFLQKKCHLPKWLAANGTLLLISLAFLGVFLLIGWLLFQQCKLLLTNLSIYHQIYTKSIESCCHNILQHLDYYLGLQKGSCLIFAKEQFHNLDPSSFTNLYQNIGRIALQCMGSSMRVCAFLLIVIVSFIVLCKDYDHLLL